VRPTFPESNAGPIHGLASLDTDVIHRAARGDRSAFDRLYDALLPLVWSLSVRHVGRSAAEAERLTERILARAILRLHEYTGKAPLARWLTELIASELRACREAPHRSSSSPSGSSSANRRIRPRG